MSAAQPPFGHPDIGPELRALAQSILDRVDPAMRAAVTLLAARSGDGPGPCQQVWCPVCALAALAAGEEHPLLTVIAEHSVALLDVVRAMVDGSGVPDPPEPGGPDGSAGDDGPASPSREGRYQSIPVTVED
ncbi:MAG TPA: hypothetical protein VFW21_12465 [Mycobacterium sp.]|nr:hypothetical protein [Mycobacterium sp.]